MSNPEEYSMAKKQTPDTAFDPSANGHSSPSPTSEGTESQHRKSILERLREEQPYMEDVEATDATSSVSWQRPSPLDWFRVHPDPAYRVTAYELTIRRSRSPYLVFGEDLQNVLRRRKQGRDVVIYTWVDRYGEVSLWGIGLGPSDWNTSARRAAIRAQEVWVRLTSNLTSQRYQYEESTKIATPTWPQKSFDALITEVFEEYVIEHSDHEIIQALLGEA
jgi:hypothetical protein